jgi:hypothetical protein
MSGRRIAALFIVLSVIVSLFASSASAALLGTGLAYNDGTKVWEGTKNFSVPSTGGTLAGTLDWAVFTTADFLTLFPSSGYIPTPGQLVYTCQLENTGTVGISLNEVRILGGAPVNNVGWFSALDVTGQVPYDSWIGSTDVVWDFRDPNHIDPNEYSMGLAFCSSRKPRNSIDVILNGGAQATISGVASPGSVDIPEPSGLMLLAFAGAAMGVGVVRRQRRK